MIIKTCVDCGAVILSNNVTARRCPVCAERFAERVRKKYKNPPADPLTADVRKADAAGKSYGYWRLDELLKEQKAREELDNLIERNRKRLDDMKNQLDGMLDDAWNARNSEIEYGKDHSVQWHGEKATAIAQAMAKLKENTNTGCFGDCATCSGAAVDDRAGTGSRPQDADDGLPS